MTKRSDIIYNVEAIKAEAYALDVARYIDMEIAKKGSKYFIKCPRHEKVLGKIDKHVGNCVLTKKGYKCYACGTESGVVDMVMDYLDCTFYEALGIIADSLGGREKYFMTKEQVDNKNSFPFTIDEMNLIGVCPHRRNKVEFIVNAGGTEFEDDLPCRKRIYGDDKEEYLYYKIEKSPTIYSLYEEDREMFNEIIKNKANETLEKYKLIEEIFLDRNSILFPLLSDIVKGKDGFIEEDELYSIRNIINNRKRMCKMILASVEAEN